MLTKFSNRSDENRKLPHVTNSHVEEMRIGRYHTTANCKSSKEAQTR